MPLELWTSHRPLPLLGPTLLAIELQDADAHGFIKLVRQHIWHRGRRPADEIAVIERGHCQASIRLTGPARSQRR
jgi:hypothetical protein